MLTKTLNLLFLFFLYSSNVLFNSLYSSLSILLSFIDLVYSLLNLSLNCLLKIYIWEYFVILFHIIVLIDFDNEPEKVAVAKVVCIEKFNPIPVNATDVVVDVVAIDDYSIFVISAMLI